VAGRRAAMKGFQDGTQTQLEWRIYTRVSTDQGLENRDFKFPRRPSGKRLRGRHQESGAGGLAGLVRGIRYDGKAGSIRPGRLDRPAAAEAAIDVQARTGFGRDLVVYKGSIGWTRRSDDFSPSWVETIR